LFKFYRHSIKKLQQPKDKQQTMNQRILIKNATIVNEGKSFIADVLIADGVIRQIGTIEIDPTYKVIDGTGKHLLPGIIDGQVHFRDPGHTQRRFIYRK
jgi:dihydroorotase